MKIGLYSKKSVLEGLGSSFYSTPSGEIVEVTAVGLPDPDGGYGSWYKWDDAISVGPVVEYVKRGKPMSALNTYLLGCNDYILEDWWGLKNSL